MSSLPNSPSSKQDPSQYPSFEPAPRVPFPLDIANLGLEVREGENIAYGWQSWAATDDGYEPPAFTGGNFEGRRVQMFVSNHRYDATLFQQVKVLAGFALTFEMKFRITPDDPASKRVRPQGIVVGVGIDPTGGSDVRGDNVQWALRDLKYSQIVTASVTAMAKSEITTVFVRIIAFIPGSGGVATGGNAIQCDRICLRTQYSRTYILLPQNATEEMWKNAASKAFVGDNNGRFWTVGASADDAGLATGLLKPKPTIKVVNYPNAWAADFGPGWFAQNYGSVNFEAI